MKIIDLWSTITKGTQYEILFIENNKVLTKGKDFQKEIWVSGLLDLYIEKIEIKNNILNIYIEKEDFEIIIEEYKERNNLTREEILEYIFSN